MAVIVSQTGFGNKRLQLAWSAPEQPGQTAALPADTAIVTGSIKPMSDATADRLAAMARDTAATRAETQRLAMQVSKLTADSFRVTGRLANIERQINGITGSIKQHAEDAATAAVAKAMPSKATKHNPFDNPAPMVSPPDTTMPKLSLLMPRDPDAAKPLTVERIKPAAMQDVTVTSAIKSKPEAAPQTDAKVARKAATKVDPDALATEAVKRSAELKAEVAAEMKAGSAAKGQIAPVSPLAYAAKPDAKMASKPAPGSAAMAKAEPKVASAAPPQRRVVRSRWSSSQNGYGVDLGSADSINVVKAQWAAVKANFGPMLRGMHPTAVRDRRLLSGGSFRLVIGRLRSLKSAERLCARFAKQKVACRPVEFNGEKIVWR